MSVKLYSRKMDELGRIALPQEVRETLGVKEKQSFDIVVEENSILLTPNFNIPVCKICGESELQLIEIDNNPICIGCIVKIRKI